MKLIASFLLVFISTILLFNTCSENLENKLVLFENRLELWRQRLKMPSFAVSVVRDKDIIFAKGDTTWVMQAEETIHAGGADKNRLAQSSLVLEAGRYRLCYKSDDSHSFNRWNAIPPEYRLYGIIIYQ
jgi:hypothetical protein